MIVIGILFGVVGIGFLCWLLFSLAVYALPFFAAVSAGLWAYHGDAGPVGAIFVGILAGVVTLVAGQYVFAFARSTWIRVAVALLFAAPAALAGYHATLGLAKLTMPSGAWQIAFSIVGAVAVGVTAWTRMALPPGHPTQGDRQGLNSAGTTRWSDAGWRTSGPTGRRRFWSMIGHWREQPTKDRDRGMVGDTHGRSGFVGALPINRRCLGRCLSVAER